MKKKILIISGAIVIFLLILLFSAVYVIVPKTLEKRRLEEEARIALETEMREKQAEEERLKLFESDEVKYSDMQYGGVFLSMTGSEGWSMDIPKGYVGIDVLKNECVIDSGEEFMTLWNAAMDSENTITNAYFILDPAKLCTKEDIPELTIDLDKIIGNNPKIDFRIFTSSYYIDYWQQYTQDEFEIICTAYEDIIKKILTYDNAVISCYTGEEWLVTNPDLFSDPEKGSLVSEIASKFFLYSYTEGWPLNENSYSFRLAKLRNVCMPAPKEEPLEEPKVNEWKQFFTFLFGEKEEITEEEKVFYDPDLSEYDIIFMGDSIFALSDGPFSSASVVKNITGAKTYNISRGGLAMFNEDSSSPMSMTSAVSNFLKGEKVNDEEWQVYNGELERYLQDDHNGRGTVIVMNCCINDYIKGNDPDEYADAFSDCIKLLKEKMPDAILIFMAPYYIQDRNNGTNLNESGFVLNSYKEAAKEVSKECGVYYLDLLATGEFNNYTAAIALEDGTHPSPLGCYEIAVILSDYINDVLESFSMRGIQ